MKKFLFLLFLPFLLGASAQDTGWFTRSNCLTLGNPQAFGTVCLNTAIGTLSQGHQYTFQGGSPGSAASWLDTTGGGSGGGSVNIFSSGNLSPLFTTSVATPTTTPALSFALSNAAANTIFGNATSGSAAPSFGQLVTGQITNSAVTLAKIQNAAASSKLLGAGATGSGIPYTEITLGTGLSMSGTTLNSTGGGVTQLTGDVLAGPGSGVLAATIANSAVSLAKIANATANSVLLGSGSSGSGSAYTQILLGSGLTMSGTTLQVNGTMTGTGTTGTIPVFTGISAIGNSIMTQPDVNTIAIGSGNTGQLQMGSLALNGTTSGTITIQPQAAAGTYNFNLPTSAGTTGQCLISGGGGTSPLTWGTCGSGSSAFNAITGGTNTTAAMIVGSGASITRTGTGIIDASLVNSLPVASVWTKTTDPSGSNNTAAGYGTGDMWNNTTASPNKVWEKVSESGGVAVWVCLSTSCLSSDVTSTIAGVATIAANAVTSAKMAVVNTRRTCAIIIPGTGASGVLQNTDMSTTLDGQDCFINAPSTLIEMTVRADGGTPNIIAQRDRLGTAVNLVSSALATAASGAQACSNTGGTTGLDGTTTCSATLQNTSLSAGDWLGIASGTAGGVAKRISVSLTYTVN